MHSSSAGVTVRAHGGYLQDQTRASGRDPTWKRQHCNTTCSRLLLLRRSQADLPSLSLPRSLSSPLPSLPLMVFRTAFLQESKEAWMKIRGRQRSRGEAATAEQDWPQEQSQSWSVERLLVSGDRDRVKKLDSEPAKVSCNIMVAPSPAELLYSRHERRGETEPDPRRIARYHHHLQWELRHGSRNPADPEVRP